MKRTAALAVGVLGGAMILANSAHGAGYAVIEQSVKGLGNAFASGAAGGEDASTVFFNPATMTKLEGDQMLGGAHTIIPNVDFRNQGSQLNPRLGGAPLTGTTSGNGGDVALVPNFYYMHSFNDRWKYGVGINSPFALATTYDLNWVGRYHAERSELLTINFNPSIAYRVNDMLSVGAGFNLQYLDVTLTNALDMSAVCLQATQRGSIPAGACQQLGLATPGNRATDGYGKLIGNSLGFGYNLGLLFEPTATTRIGLHYRSDIDQEADGDANFGVPAAAAVLQSTGAFRNTTARAVIDLPATASVSAFQELNQEWAVMADVTWTHWSRFKEIRVNYDNPVQQALSQPTPELWDDAFRYSVGATYRPSTRPYIVRMGFAFDESPIANTNLRTPRIPDSDRKWLAFGGSYAFTKAISLDASYAHIFVDDAPVNNVDVNSGHLLVGEFGLDVDIFSVQLAWKLQ